VEGRSVLVQVTDVLVFTSIAAAVRPHGVGKVTPAVMAPANLFLIVALIFHSVLPLELRHRRGQLRARPSCFWMSRAEGRPRRSFHSLWPDPIVTSPYGVALATYRTNHCLARTRPSLSTRIYFSRPTRPVGIGVYFVSLACRGPRWARQLISEGAVDRDNAAVLASESIGFGAGILEPMYPVKRVSSHSILPNEPVCCRTPSWKPPSYLVDA
jgi:hypothetical protein